MIVVNWEHIQEDAVATALGIGAGLAGILALWKISQQVGGFTSYTGLSKEETQRIYEELLTRCDVLSSTEGTTWDGKYFRRGILLGGAVTYPTYYRYVAGDGDASLELYPLASQPFSEAWLTNPDIFGTTGDLVTPKP